MDLRKIWLDTGRCKSITSPSSSLTVRMVWTGPLPISCILSDKGHCQCQHQKGSTSHCPWRVMQPHTGFVHRGCPKELAAVLEKTSLNSPQESCLSNPSNVHIVFFIFILFSGVNHVSIRLDLETLFQFSHLILTFKVPLLPELLCNVIHWVLNHGNKLLR